MLRGGLVAVLYPDSFWLMGVSVEPACIMHYDSQQSCNTLPLCKGIASHTAFCSALTISGQASGSGVRQSANRIAI